MNIQLVYTVIALFFWTVLGISFTKDRSRYRNCFLLFFAIASSIAALTFLAGDRQKEVLVGGWLICMIAVCFLYFAN